MPSQWDEVREDFPALADHTFLNAASCSPTPRLVRAAVDDFYRDLEMDADLKWRDWTERKEAVRATVARFVGAEADEIAFVANTSTGMNLVADLLADDGPVLTDEIEFPAV